ncbi:MAG: A/G-specific adenine glycosylase [Actinomycetota bacterium]
MSEVMLQQTQASRVEPVFEAFLARFPTVEALARASRADVLKAWSGMGYNSRAVRLHGAARGIVERHGGRVPPALDLLRTLPGVGPYTASAVASIAFGQPVVAVDTNVRRIVARVAFGSEPDEVPAAALSAAAQRWVDPDAPGDRNQALMDLGREVCRAAPRCELCPLSPWCRFRRSGRAGRPSTRRQPAFEGSRRQARGRVVEALRARPSATVTQLVDATGFDEERVRGAVDGLVRDGVVAVGRGRVRLGS